MTDQPTTSQRTVLAVVAILGAFAIVGLAGVIWLIDHEKDPAAIAIVSTLTGSALGAIAGVLSNTRTAPLDDPAKPPPWTGVIADHDRLQP